MLNLSSELNLPESDHYIDRNGHIFFLKELDEQQQALIRELREFAAGKPDWTEYQNYWMPKVGDFYKARSMTRRETIQTTAWRIAQDLGSRLGLDEGWMREGDYRDELGRLILSNFKTRRAFCEATGLSEDMLSHVLAGRKNLGIETLTNALQQIGFTLHIAPLSGANPQ